MSGILVLTTGGTIGALAHPDPRTPPPIVPMPPDGRDIVREILQAEFRNFNARCISFEPRDSKFIDDDYLMKALKLIEAAPEDKILITYGTDALLRGANFFYRHAGLKKIILTGSMTPLANGAESDGYRNLTCALKCLRDDVCGDSCVNIILSDFNDAGIWVPRLYPFQPDKYEKFYDIDGRYNRLRVKP